MRVPDQAVAPRPHLMRRYQAAILLVVVAIILLLIIVQVAADAYTNYLWYRSIHETMVWRSMAETKVGLGLVFCSIFFCCCWASLWAVERFTPIDAYVAADGDLVRRYRVSVWRYRLVVRTVVSLALALAVGVGTSGQWQHLLLFLNGGRFGLKDPEFGRDVGFFVFRLPFLSFLVDWFLVALVVLFLVTAAAHYLNGGLRFYGPSPRIEKPVVAHLSLILAVMALVRAAGYFFVDRFGLDLSSNGVVDGAGYTDVHVRLPALSLLAMVCILGFVFLSLNVYFRTVSLAVVAVGLWAFVALLIGVIYPIAVQWLKVDPSQSTVELPYIERNIAATRYAYGLDSMKAERFSAEADLNANVINANRQTLYELPLWDPSAASVSYTELQGLKGYYELSGLAVDRYVLGTGANRATTPVVVGVRDIKQSAEPRPTWLNEHLVYTHGYGIVLAPADSSGVPQFAVGGAPVHSSPGSPRLRRPEIYFADSKETYVVVDTKEPELDYATGDGPRAETSHYSGSGGIRLSGFWQRLSYAIKFHDVNLLDSSVITSKSRIIYDQDVKQLVEKAAPFLKIDAHPYPVVAGGQIWWMVDAYTTSNDFPYSERISSDLGSEIGVGTSTNYARDAVQVVVNAYTGRVRLFALDPSDPVLIAWEHAYPGLVEPLSRMRDLTPDGQGVLLRHLRYPQNFLMMQAAMYGRYRFLPTPDQASQFYSVENAWGLAQGQGRGRYVPTYELVRLPGQSSLSFVCVEPLVPEATNGAPQLLTAFVTAQSSYSTYGSLTAYELPRASSRTAAPSVVEERVEQDAAISRAKVILKDVDSHLDLGPSLLVPIEDSVVYVEPIYVRTGHSYLTLAYVATDVPGDHIGLGTTLLASLREIFGDSVANLAPTSRTVPEQIEHDLDLAYRAYEASLSAEQHGRLGALQADLAQVGTYLTEAHALMATQVSHVGTPSNPEPSITGSPNRMG